MKRKYLVYIATILVIITTLAACSYSYSDANKETTIVTEPTEEIIETTSEITEPTVEETDPIIETTVPETEPPEIPTDPGENDNEETKEWVYDDTLSAVENIFIYLTDYLGFSNAASCGIISNIAHETGWKFNPKAGSLSSSYGLIQWQGGRLNNLKKWCSENGKDYNSIQGQLDFMYWELVNADPYGTYKHLMQCEDNIDGAYDAGWYFCYWYERPSNKKARANLRGNDAKEYYEKLVQGPL